MSMIRINNLTFAYPGSYDNVFEDVSLQLDSDWKLGLVGRNGRGKTTLLRLLMGEYLYEGTISAQLPFDYFPYAVENEGDSALEVVERAAPEAEHWQIRRELSLLEVDEGTLYQPFATLSGGERTKMLLAALFLRPGRFMLIDEPTNHLDFYGRHVLGEYLSRQKGFIVVSHDRQFLDRCIDHVLSINRKSIDCQKGNYSSWAQNKADQDARELAQNEKLKGDIRRLEGSAKRVGAWSDQVERSKIGGSVSSYNGGGPFADRGHIGAKAAKMMQRSKSIMRRKEAAVEEKEALLHDIEYEGELKMRPLQDKRGLLLECRDISVSYGEKEALSHFDLQLREGERVALWGANGSGKSSALKVLLGTVPPSGGEIWRAGGLRISYVPQDSDFLQGSLRDYARLHELDETLFMTILRKFGFPREQFEKEMGDYSAGQRKKVLLATSLAQSAHVYIWDEPLNYIDVISRIQVEKLIKNAQPTLLLVEHDGAFLDEVITRRVEL